MCDVYVSMSHVIPIAITHIQTNITIILIILISLFIFTIFTIIIIIPLLFSLLLHYHFTHIHTMHTWTYSHIYNIYTIYYTIALLLCMRADTNTMQTVITGCGKKWKEAVKTVLLKLTLMQVGIGPGLGQFGL